MSAMPRTSTSAPALVRHERLLAETDDRGLPAERLAEDVDATLAQHLAVAHVLGDDRASLVRRQRGLRIRVSVDQEQESHGVSFTRCADETTNSEAAGRHRASTRCCVEGTASRRGAKVMRCASLLIRRNPSSWPPPRVVAVMSWREGLTMLRLPGSSGSTRGETGVTR
jgi:hypothetical protein